MANRVKEDERNERIIRGLLKLPENRRCINCNSLGPQYVCTNFWTFMCTTCSGIHREFTHRVKSVSMAKFTPQEVAALQEGGNQRAREIFLKEWDSQRQSFPDGSNIERLRDFIKHVYVDRRYSGDRNSGKLLSAKIGDKEEFSDIRKTEPYQGGSRSPTYGETYERRYSDMSSPGGRSDDRNSRYGYEERRSPGYDQEGRSHSDYRRSSTRPDVINDRRREDRFDNIRKGDDQGISDGNQRLENRSPVWQKDSEVSSPPLVRPVREILGDNIVPLCIAEPPKANISRIGNDSGQPQQAASSSSLVSTNTNPLEIKVENTRSLIDFDADPEPPVAAVSQKTTTRESSAPLASTANDNNWASFDFTPEVKILQSPSNESTLQSALTQLSVSASVTGQVSGMSSGNSSQVAASLANTLLMGGSSVRNASTFVHNAGAHTGTHVGNAGTFLPGGASASASASGVVQTMPFNSTQAGRWSGLPTQAGQWFGLPTTQHSAPMSGGTLGNQPWSSSLGLNTPSVGGPQVIPSAVSGGTSSGISQPSAGEVKLSGRKELPEDLFTASHSSYYGPMPGWQTGLPRGMGFAMPHPNMAMLMPTIHQMPKSANPFDVNEPPPAQPQLFPSMTPVQVALPHLPPSSGLQRTSSLGNPLPAWNQSELVPYQLGLPSTAPSYGSALPPRPYMAQQLPNNISFSGYMGTGGLGNQGATFSDINTDQQHAGRYSAPATPQPFSTPGGNPFG